MKYTIVVNQRVVADVNAKIENRLNRLDLVDCAILEWVVQICASKDPRISQAREDGMTWISYQKLIDDMPLLNITTKSGITKRLAKLSDGGFIRLITKNQRVYIDYTLKAEKLTYENGQKSVYKPFPTVNGSRKTVSHSQQNRFPQSTNKYTNTNTNKNLKIHEREHKVNDDLKIPVNTRVAAMKDWLRERIPGEAFVEFFNKNRGRYITA